MRVEEIETQNSQPGTATLVRVYAYGNDLISQHQLLVDGNGGPVWATSFYGYDGHGNVRYLTDVNGAVTDTYDCDAFGDLIAQSSIYNLPTPNSYLYCGEQFDSVLGLYYIPIKIFENAMACTGCPHGRRGFNHNVEAMRVNDSRKAGCGKTARPV